MKRFELAGLTFVFLLWTVVHGEADEQRARLLSSAKETLLGPSVSRQSSGVAGEDVTTCQTSAPAVVTVDEYTLQAKFSCDTALNSLVPESGTAQPVVIAATKAQMPSARLAQKNQSLKCSAV